jgi:hypothetical protein
MSAAQIPHSYQKIDASDLQKLTQEDQQSWVNQQVSPETTMRFQVLMNGPSQSSGVASTQATAGVGAGAAAGTKPNAWDDVFHREELVRALAAMSNVQPQEMPAAAARVTVISLDMQMKVDSVRQASKSTEDSVQSMLRA